MTMRSVMALAGAAGLWLSAAAMARADGPPPASQPCKVLVKLVVGTTKTTADGLPSEPWIVEQTQRAGLPVARDSSGWTELAGQPRKLEAFAIGDATYEASARRDSASRLLMIDVAGPRKKSLVMADQIGERDVFKLADLPDGGDVFIAVQLVAASAKLAEVWGETANSVRMSMRVETQPWPVKGPVNFVGLVQNVSGNQMQCPMWAGHMRVPLEITDAGGKAVAPQTASPSGRNPMGWWGGQSQLPPRSMRTVSASGTMADGTLTMSSNSGTVWKWKLPAGKYRMRGVVDFQDFPYRGTGAPAGPVSYSQWVDVVIAAPTSQPDAP